MANFLEQYLSPAGTIGSNVWTMGTKTHSPTQVKVAIQQLLNKGVGINNAPGQFFAGGGPMKGVPGMYSPKNPMGQFQGPGGNLGFIGYSKAKLAGYTPQEIKQGAAAGGMFLPSGAERQYQMDMRAEAERDQMLDYMRQLQEMANRPEPQVGRSSSYVVGTGGTAEIQQADKPKEEKKGRGTGKWKREYFNALNTAAVAGAGGGTVNP
ncbi:MAG: hypothetical protein CL886_09180 [Dehalococcoidia bacterium]|nr:hypothetical protein [Dehalococcoidia bacterium]|tara:strand:+ start:786 stop:1412 length:627 start_codon:yes stop_codon:yes gene_type:complete